MFSFKMLLSALALALLAVTVQSRPSSSSSPKGSSSNFNYDLSGPDLTTLYNSPVSQAEKVVRPLSILPFAIGPISHSGVKVTLEDGSQWLVHKGDNYGLSSDTVVTRDDHMSSRWKPSGETRDFNGEKTVGDFVSTGGDTYKLLGANCHDATEAMMNQ